MQDLYAFRDRFFETHPIELAKEKRKLVESKMNDVINQIDELSRKIFLLTYHIDWETSGLVIQIVTFD